MIDPRFKEVLEFIDERDEDGVPSIRAKLALKIQGYAQDVANLRKELADMEASIDGMQDTVHTLSFAIDEQAAHKIDLVTEAQDAAVRAAMSGSGGGSARLRRIAQATRDRIDEFQKDFDADQIRLDILRDCQDRAEQFPKTHQPNQFVTGTAIDRSSFISIEDHAGSKFRRA